MEYIRNEPAILIFSASPSASLIATTVAIILMSEIDNTIDRIVPVTKIIEGDFFSIIKCNSTVKR